MRSRLVRSCLGGGGLERRHRGCDMCCIRHGHALTPACQTEAQQWQHQQRNDEVLPESHLDGVHAPIAATVADGQAGKAQPRGQPPQEPHGALVAHVERGRDQHQPQGDERQHRALCPANALAEQHDVQQGDEGREAGKAQRGHRNAAHLDGHEEGDPVHGQQKTAGQHNAGAARAQPLQQRPALRQGQHQQCGCGEPCPAGRDGHGIETDEGAEDAGEPEKHGHPMGSRECADVRILHDPLIVGACQRSGHPDQPCQCTRWICSVLQASCSFFTPSMKWAVLLWASSAA